VAVNREIGRAMNMKEFVVWCVEDGETEEGSGRRIGAFDGANAAEEWAARDDCESAEYRVVGGARLTVCVRELPDGDVRHYVVGGEAVPHYFARPAVGPKTTTNEG